MQADVENSHETARSQGSATMSWSSASRVAQRTHIENSRPTLQPYSSRIELAFPSRSSTIRIPISGFALAKRALGFGLGRTLFSLSRKRLGLVSEWRSSRAIKIKPFSWIPCSCRAGRTCRAGLTHSPRSPPPFTDACRLRSPTRFLELSGSGTAQGWIVQLCHFHLISRLQNCRGRRNCNLADRPLREALYQQVRQALELPDGPRLQTVLNKLRHLVQKATRLRVMRMIVREFLRRIDHFRAYRKYPELDLPTTTGSVEAMNRRVRDLMRQIRSVRSPQALQFWATALI
jgi:hypothetical protein